MINFFRKARQNLLNEGKTARYFKYAIGEIVLVVIGILIALQINNWNEQRKFNNLKIIYIEMLLFDIKQDTVRIIELSKKLKQQQQTIITIMDEIDSEIAPELLIKPFEDYFRYGWVMYDFTANMDTYNDLSQSGNMNVFKNSILAKSIKQYYLTIENNLKSQIINKDWIIPIDVKLSSETSVFEFDPMTKELFHKNDPLLAINNLLNHKPLFKRNAAGHYWFNKSLQNSLERTSTLAIELSKQLQSEINKNSMSNN